MSTNMIAGIIGLGAAVGAGLIVLHFLGRALPSRTQTYVGLAIFVMALVAAMTS